MFSNDLSKFVKSGLAEPGASLLGLRGDEWQWSGPHALIPRLEKVLDALGRRAALYCEPSEPYRSILARLAETEAGVVKPGDFETRIFLTDLPVARDPDVQSLGTALQSRRCILLRGGAVLATARSSPEGAFLGFSAACFAGFVTYFSTLLTRMRDGSLDGDDHRRLGEISKLLAPPPSLSEPLRRGPFTTEADIMEALAEAGAATVRMGLVDANFGNISYRLGDRLYISRRGAPLDELAGKIASVAAGTPSGEDAGASTELPSHRRIVSETRYRAVLHGHPKFAVILSLDCPRRDCRERGDCHRRCPHPWSIGGVPVVTGDAGGGEWGLERTVPPAVSASGAALVYGHGLFTAGETDFNGPVGRLLEIENACRDRYFSILEGGG
ncbi:MAG: rRNA adenine dimethylase [Syntrophaceae bacterium]|nr:rRNA adenine dimethylase [Syntrophaceae bacterium]